MYFRSLVAAPILALTLAGCAYVSAVPVGPDSQISGIRVPECKPLISVVGNSVSILWITNPDRQTALNFGTFLAKHDMTVGFTNGCLTSLNSKQDATDVPVAFIKLVQAAVEKGTSLASAFSAAQTDTAGGIAQIYDPVFDGQGNLVKLRPLIDRRDFQRIPRARAQALGTGNGAVAAAVNTGGQTSTNPGGQTKNNSQ